MSQAASSPTQSQKSSPSQSAHRLDGQISVDTLISWLVAAKRSLSNIHHVHRATNILTEARLAIESTTAVIARTKYLRRSLTSQVNILRGIQYEIEVAAQSIKQDIQSTLKDLQDSDNRLSKNIHELKTTRIEEGFKNIGHERKNAAEQDVNQKDTLHDFVDDNPVADIRRSTHDAVNSTEDAQNIIEQGIMTLEAALQSINEALSDRTASSSSTHSDIQPPHIPTVLRTLEAHAREMAESLESLVKHFDLCVTAIKHTEGGGAAVARTINTEDLPEGVDVEALASPIQPITYQEREEMLAVLQNDAAEVDEVVMELQDRGAEMDVQLEHIMFWRDSSLSVHHDVAKAFRFLEEIGDRLSAYLAETSRFGNRWAEEKAKIRSGIAGMDELCEVYDNFLLAYDGMIVEAARRRTVRKKMEKIVNEAQAQLDKLYDDDIIERDHFRSERGDFLPSDIWHGLDSLPSRFGFERQNDEGIASVPDLPKEVVTSALKRLKSAQGWQERSPR